MPVFKVKVNIAKIDDHLWIMVKVNSEVSGEVAGDMDDDVAGRDLMVWHLFNMWQKLIR